jgi:hypothetical protein
MRSPAAWRSVASACGVALEHGLDVRRPLGRELFVQVQHALHHRDHPVVPRDVGGGGENDDAAPCARDNALVSRSEAVMTQQVEKLRANAANWIPILGPHLQGTSLF